MELNWSNLLLQSGTIACCRLEDTIGQEKTLKVIVAVSTCIDEAVIARTLPSHFPNVNQIAIDKMATDIFQGQRKRDKGYGNADDGLSMLEDALGDMDPSGHLYGTLESELISIRQEIDSSHTPWSDVDPSERIRNVEMWTSAVEALNKSIQIAWTIGVPA